MATICAQNTTVALGDWRSHLSYSSTVGLAESDDAIFFGTPEAVLKVYKADQSLEYINKVWGTSDMRVQTLAYHQEEQMLIVAYLNGNLDLIYDGGTVVNLPAILNNNTIIDKSIYDIYTNGKQIYLSCAFGLTIYDLDLEAFSQTTFTPVEVVGCTRLNNELFIATAQGIYKGIDDGRNLLDFTVWEKQTQNLPNFYDSRAIIQFNGKIYADINGELYVYDQGTWGTMAGFDVETQTSFTRWQPTGGGDFIPNHRLSLSYDKTTLIVTSRSQKYFLINANQEVETRNYPGSWRVLEVAIDQDGIHWAADQGLMHRDGQRIRPNAPSTRQASDLYTDEEGTLWVAASSYNTIQAFFNRDGFLQYKEGIWKTFDEELYPAVMDTFYDVIRIAANPTNGRIYASSFMSGLLEYDPATDVIRNFDQYTPNAPLEGVSGDDLRTRIQGLAIDDDGNVWVTLTEAPSTGLAVLRRDGTWKGYPLSYFRSGNKLGDVVIDRNGYKWIKQITGNITVFDSGNLDNDSDDRSFLITPNNSELPVQEITALASDKEGAIWVGTTDGIVIFNCSATLFDGSCTGRRPIISQDNFNGYLLEGEHVRAIAVDGANRKWVGTNNGLFLLDGDTYEQLAYLTEDNSPLFDNEVQQLAVDDVSGYVYIATDLGLQSLRGEATGGRRRMPDCLGNVFPNPVEPGYQGPIAISDLPTNANVKITDASGRLVYETDALGGQAIWDGMDYTGRRAQSGVYFAFVVTEDGGQKGMCKILFMN